MSINLNISSLRSTDDTTTVVKDMEHAPEIARVRTGETLVSLQSTSSSECSSTENFEVEEYPKESVENIFRDHVAKVDSFPSIYLANPIDSQENLEIKADKDTGLKNDKKSSNSITLPLHFRTIRSSQKQKPIPIYNSYSIWSGSDIGVSDHRINTNSIERKMRLNKMGLEKHWSDYFNVPCLCIL